MKTIKTTVYNFEELSDKSKQVAIADNQDINVNFEWWESTYEDAERIGLKITSFDLDRNRHAEGNFLLSANEVSQNILNEHGEQCETYKTTEAFMEVWQPVFDNYITEEEDNEEELIEIENDFLNNILEDYSVMLQNEYEYLISDEAIAETLISNEYEFTEDGKRF